MHYSGVLEDIEKQPRVWLVTGAAGFIGSNLVHGLLAAGQHVVGLDNFATGNAANLADIQKSVTPETWGRLRFIEGDTRDLDVCRKACQGVDIVLHQAALGSVPRSINDPISSHTANVDGFLNMLVAARDVNVHRFVYASSSSVYGDNSDLPKVESRTGTPLSPYALTKVMNEQYAAVFGRTYGFKPIGLRYFNVFGRRQKPDGPYAAVMPRWIRSLLNGETCHIYGDGETSRDFCYIANVVQANILAGLSGEEALGHVFNISFGGRTTLTNLYGMIRDRLAKWDPELATKDAIYEGFRDGDISHSQADTTKARSLLGYEPTHSVAQGLDEAVEWFVNNLRQKA